MGKTWFFECHAPGSMEIEPDAQGFGNGMTAVARRHGDDVDLGGTGELKLGVLPRSALDGRMIEVVGAWSILLAADDPQGQGAMAVAQNESPLADRYLRIGEVLGERAGQPDPAHAGDVATSRERKDSVSIDDGMGRDGDRGLSQKQAGGPLARRRDLGRDHRVRRAEQGFGLKRFEARIELSDGGHGLTSLS